MHPCRTPKPNVRLSTRTTDFRPPLSGLMTKGVDLDLVVLPVVVTILDKLLDDLWALGYRESCWGLIYHEQCEQ